MLVWTWLGILPLALANTPPTVDSVSVTPESPMVGDTLHCSATVEDADGDTPILGYRWTIDGAEAGTQASLEPGAFKKGQSVLCEVAASDASGVGQLGRSTPVLIANTAPKATRAAVHPAKPTTTDDLTCTAEGEDADGDSLSYAYTWSDGSSGATLGAANTKRGTTYTCTATPSDGDSQGATAKSNAVTVANTAPTLASATITPTGPTSADPLLCTATGAADADRDNVEIRYAWKRDGRTLASGAELAASNTRKGQRLTCEATPSDGTATGEPVSAEVSIGNSPPELESVVLSDAIRGGDPVKCSVKGATDADGDPITLAYSWTVQGQSVDLDAAELPGKHTRKGAVIACSVTASDGEQAGATARAESTVLNSTPTLTGATLSPEKPTTTDPLVCEAQGAEDPDGDPLNVLYHWTVGGQPSEHGGSTLPASRPNRGDMVTCTVTVSDGEEESAKHTASRTVLNTPPELGQAAIEPATPLTTDALSCQVSGTTDADQDDVSVRYVWRAGETVLGTAQTLPASSTRKGREITCEATPSDGTSKGAPVRSQPVTVGNTPPTLTAAKISPAELRVGADARCSATGAADADGESVGITYRWTVGTVSHEGPTLPGKHLKKGATVTCTATPTDAEGSGSPVQAKATVSNTAPTLASATVSPQGATTDDAIRCAAEGGEDADGDPVTYAYSWTVDGAAQDTTGPTLAASTHAKGQSIHCTVTPSDGESPGTARSASIRIANAPPTAGSVALSPASPSTSDTLTCEVAAGSDPDGDAVSYRYQWLADGTPLSGQTRATLAASATRKGQKIHCSATPSDGTVRGEPRDSAPSPVVNSAPSIATATLSPASPRVGQDVRCAATGAKDADGDPVTLRASWTVGGAASTVTTPMLPGSELRKGAEVVCTLTPTDGEAAGEPKTAAVTVVNTPPVLASVGLSPESPATTDAIQCSPGESTDADGDSVSYRYQWLVDGRAIEQTGPSLPASAHRRGQRVQCRVTPHDGDAEGRPATSASVAILNTPPVAAGAKLGPDAPKTPTTLTCSAEGTDVDDDPVSFRYAWFVDGTQVAGQSSSKLPGSSHKRGQAVHCEVTPWDGRSTGAPVAAAPLTILNSAPSVRSAAVTPSTATAGTELVCAASGATDPDGDPVEVRYSWQVDGANAGSGASFPGTPRRDTEILCVAAPTDGSDSGESVSSAVVRVRNTPPTVSEVTLDPVKTDQPLVARVSSDDADGDPVELGWSWTVNGVAKQAEDTLAPNHFRKGDRIGVRVTPRDETHSGPSRSASTTILNSAPGPFEIEAPTPPGGPHDLVCKLAKESKDPDGDRLTYRFSWELEGTDVRIEGDRVPVDRLRRDQRWTCSATVSDGVDSGPVASRRVAVVVPELTTGALHGCTLYSDGRIACWGDPTFRQVDGPYGQEWRRLSANGWHSCALSSEGEAACWGYNNRGQTDRQKGVVFADISAGGYHTCGIEADSRSLRCWGASDGGQLDAPSGAFDSVHSGWTHSCGLRSNGEIVCWGDNDVGQTDSPQGSFVQLDTVKEHGCAISTEGSIACWGANAFDQIEPPPGRYLHVSTGWRHSCAIREDRQIVCWGDAPGADQIPSGTFVGLSASEHFTCGLDLEGKVHCWGDVDNIPRTSQLLEGP